MPTGDHVLKEVQNLTGLPEQYLNEELSRILGTAHASVNELSLDQLRLVLMHYLETINAQMLPPESLHTYCIKT
jgi:hypothetical protein